MHPGGLDTKAWHAKGASFTDSGGYSFSEQIIAKKTATESNILQCTDYHQGNCHWITFFLSYDILIFYYLWLYLFLSMFFLWRPGRVLYEVHLLSTICTFIYRYYVSSIPIIRWQISHTLLVYLITCSFSIPYRVTSIQLDRLLR